MINEIKKYDSSFDEELFKSKISNIFTKLMLGVIKRDLSDIEHFLNKDTYSKYNQFIESLKKKKIIQMYDDFEICNIYILNYEVQNDNITIQIELICKSMDYEIDEESKNYIDGINTNTLNKIFNISITKNLKAKPLTINRQCPNCGNSLSINTTGKCTYCNQIFYQEGYDYIITQIKERTIF